MCGRYASARKRIELLEEFSVQRDKVTEPLRPDYNVAPTKPVYAVLDRAGRAGSSPGPGQDDGQGTDAGVARELRVVRWGLVPSWAKDTAIGSRLINARAETVAEKPSFRRAFARRRCLLPADGYYEWQVLAGEGTKKIKQPYFIYRADGGPLAFAGLYELWRDRQFPDGDPDAWLWTATIITTSAPDELGQIHDRMPMVIRPESWSDWLDPANTEPGDLQALLAPAMAGGLATYPVSTAVNSVRNNGPELIERLPADRTAPLRPLPSGTGPPPATGPAGETPA
ncbi:MAG TPA: SOS response-associated peptidase [Streptosporangiaceae bacterium]|nr:SOS response-associated peptidase [Streptosporangiaceae bacterium]